MSTNAELCKHDAHAMHSVAVEGSKTYAARVAQTRSSIACSPDNTLTTNYRTKVGE
jgi:hypothetical protein